MGIFKDIFGKKKPKFTEEEQDNFHESKDAGLKAFLGEMAPMVGHAIIPFALGGVVDMYYYPNFNEGTAFATQELIELGGKGPIPNQNGLYELVAFTKHKYEHNKDPNTPFNLIERSFCGILTGVGNFSFQAKLEPNETCELPDGDNPNICLVFDDFQVENKSFRINGKEYSLLLVLQIQRDEMEFAREHGSPALFDLMKKSGVYPFSDLDRPSLVS